MSTDNLMQQLCELTVDEKLQLVHELLLGILMEPSVQEDVDEYTKLNNIAGLLEDLIED